MDFTEEERKKLKTMMHFLVKKKHKESDGKCGFHMSELKPILDELELEGIIRLRPAINTYQYFLNHKNK